MGLNNIEKAIEVLEFFIEYIGLTEVEHESFCLAIQTLEKQEPKKVKYINSGTAVCPDEDCYCSLYRWYNNCPDCGQKLDWSAENE